MPELSCTGCLRAKSSFASFIATTGLTNEVVHDRTAEREDDDLADRHSPQCLREILGLFHLSDETGEGDLADEGVANVHEGAHSCDKRRSCRGDSEDDRFDGSGFSWVAFGMLHDAGKDGREQD